MMLRPEVHGKGQALDGDKTTTGATLISSLSNMAVCQGRGVIRHSDRTTSCPKCGKPGVVIDGHPGTIFFGQPTALDGHMVKCGCPIGSNRIIAPLGPLSSNASNGGTEKVGKTMTAQALVLGDLKADSPDNKGPFDEQLCLTCTNGNIPSGLKYVAYLADGTTQEGETDENGRTARIVTQKSVQITRLELTPPEEVADSCCSAKAPGEPLIVDLQPIKAFTNTVNIGTSIQNVPLPEGDERALTTGEIAMARTVFKDAIDYSKVKVHHGGWWLFLGAQNTAVTPNGEMYFPERTGFYRNDFSKTNDGRDRALFMHEITHVWQYQMGHWVKWHALWVTSRGVAAYRYKLSATGKLSNYNMEQQGEIISDYYMICIERKPNDVWNISNAGKSPTLLTSTVQGLLNSPDDRNNLPN